MLQLFAKSQLRGRITPRLAGLRKSPFSSGSIRLAVEPASVPKPPKRHRIRNFLIVSTLLFAGFSSGAVYYALKDDDFYYTLTSYVPFANVVVDGVDDFLYHRQVSASQPSNVHSSVSRSVQTVPGDSASKAQAAIAANPEPKASKPKNKVEQAADAVLGVSKDIAKRAEKEAEKAVGSGQEAGFVSPRVTPAYPKPVGKGVVLPPTTAVHETVDATGIDPMLSDVTDAINVCIRAHDVDLSDDAFFSDLVSALKTASDRVTNERDQLKAQYNSDLKSQTSAALEGADKEYLAAKLNLVESYNNRLQLALDAVTKKAVASANNKVAAQYVELFNQFRNKVVDYVEQERDGRLSQMKELQKDVETLQEAMLSSGRILESEDGVVSFFVELGNLQRILSKQEVVPLKPYVDALTRALPSDPLVQAVANSISPSVKKYGVLSHTQLAARFSLIEPKIRQASLAPPDAGIAGHLGSLAASQLLARKEGLPEGKDVESIIARTQTYLQQGDVLHAVAEINSLQGWPKKIAADWLDEGRKRSEIEFLVTVLSDEGRLWSISRN